MDILVKIEHLILSGQHHQALEALRSISQGKIPRPNRVKLADFARRLQQPLLATKILAPIIMDHLSKAGVAQPEEIISYARSLAKLSFFHEVEKWTEMLDPKQFPEIYDIKARSYMAQWNYQASLHPIRRFRNSLDRGSYQYQIANLNYVACLVGDGSDEEAIAEILQTFEQYQNDFSPIIQSNLYQMLSQSYVMSGQFQKARESLDAAASLLKGQQGIFSFYAKKWLAICRLFEMGPTAEVLSQFFEISREAKAKGFFEDQRDLERYLNQKDPCEKRTLKLYFGTLHESYRKQILLEAGLRDRPKKEYHWAIHGDSDSKILVQLSNVGAPGSVVSSLFSCLTHDFYRPLPLGYIYSTLHPEEYMNPFQFKERIYGNVSSLRRSLEENTNLKVGWDSFGACLQADTPVSIVVPAKRRVRSKKEMRLDLLRSEMKRSWFTSRDVAHSFDCSARTANNIIKMARDQYKMEKKGGGSATRYRFVG